MSRSRVRAACLVLAGIGAGIAFTFACGGAPVLFGQPIDMAGPPANCGTCTVAGPITVQGTVTLATPAKVVTAETDPAQLDAGYATCSSSPVQRNGCQTKIADGPFALTDAINLPNGNSTSPAADVMLYIVATTNGCAATPSRFIGQVLVAGPRLTGARQIVR